MQTETRVFTQQAVELRDDGDGSQLSGYAAVFYREGEEGTEFRLWDDVYERIAPTAFDRALNEKHDVRALFNHDPNQILGRSGNTLRLTVDSVGLRYDVDLPQSANVVREAIQRGDITGSSFQFRATGVEWTEEENRSIRTVNDVDLLDVGPVTFPAYTGTSTLVRSEFDRWTGNHSAAARRRKLALLALTVDAGEGKR